MLTIQGQITSAGPNPIPLQRATVRLEQFWTDGPIAMTFTDQWGNYKLEEMCTPDVPETQMWIEAEAVGYWMASSNATAASQAQHFSDPPIYCTSEAQVINLSLRVPPTFTIRGRIVTAASNPMPIPGATVNLRRFYNPETVATTTTDGAGNYELSYKYPYVSPCEPTDDSGHIIEASAQGYVTATSTAADPRGGPSVSDPPIYCSSDPQVVNLSLQPAP